MNVLYIGTSCAESQSVGRTFSSSPLRRHGRCIEEGPFSSCARCPAQLQRESPSPGDSSHWQGGVFCNCSENENVYSQHIEFPFMSKFSHRTVNRLKPCYSTKFLLIQNIAELFLLRFAHTVIQ